MTMRHATDTVRTRIAALVAAAVLLGGAAACDTESLVDLKDPDLIELPVAVDPDNLESVRNGAAWLLANAMTGPAANNATPGLIGVSGLLADELWYASTFQGMRDIDAREIFDTNGNVGAVFLWLQQARNMAEQADSLYELNAPDSGDRAFLHVVQGYGYLLLAETFCSHVPFNSTPLAPAGSEPIDYGPGLTTTEMLNESIVRFDRAVAFADAAGAVEYGHAARVGKARALQNLGSFAEAAAVVADVPDAFELHVEYSDNSAAQNNGVWYNNWAEGRSSAATDEGGNGIHFFNFSSSGVTSDPRALAGFAGSGLGTSIPLFIQGQYQSRGADVALATGLEARLIEAEAAADGGQSDAYLAILNALRAGIGLEPLADPGSPAGRILQLYEERAFWLWFTGHRLGDLRRLIRVYGAAPYGLPGMTADDLFPVGATIFNRAYGDDVALPVPDNERNNPNFDPDQCVTTEA